jgi:hypothetical protein
LIGSFSALPSWIAEPDASVPRATDISVMIFVVWLKMSLPAPAWFLMFVNVSSRFWPDWIASSSMPVFLAMAAARSPTCFADTPAAPPVDLMTCVVRAAIFRDSSAASYSDLKPSIRPAPSSAPAASFMPLAIVEPNPEVCLPACSAESPTFLKVGEALSLARTSKTSDRFATTAAW